MKVVFKFLGMLLGATLVAIPQATLSFSETHPTSSPADYSTGCHGRGNESHPTTPSHSRQPHPSNYSCCLTGHNAAIVQVFPHPELLTLVAKSQPDCLIFTVCRFENSQTATLFSPHLLRRSPLRI